MSGRKSFNNPYSPLTRHQNRVFKHKEDINEFNHCGKVEFENEQQTADRQTLTQQRNSGMKIERRKAERLLLCNFLLLC